MVIYLIHRLLLVRKSFFTLLILLINKHGKRFHLSVPSSVSLLSVLKFSLQRSLTFPIGFLVRFLHVCMLVCAYVCTSVCVCTGLYVMSGIQFLPHHACYCTCIQGGCRCAYVNLNPATLLKVFSSCKSTLVETSLDYLQIRTLVTPPFTFLLFDSLVIFFCEDLQHYTE